MTYPRLRLPIPKRDQASHPRALVDANSGVVVGWLGGRPGGGKPFMHELAGGSGASSLHKRVRQCDQLDSSNKAPT